jgi:hypothetical protein
MGWFSDLFSGKLSPFCEKEKNKEYIVTKFLLFKIPITGKKNPKICQKSPQLTTLS